MPYPADTFFDLVRQVYYLSQDVHGANYSLGQLFEDLTRHYPDFTETDITKMHAEGLLEATYSLLEELKYYRGK